MRAGLGAIPGITVHDRGTVKSAIVTFSHKEVATTEIVNRLRLEHRINTSASDVQLTRTDTLDTGIKAMVRASPHVYNTEDEIDTLLNAVAGIVQVRK
jgi:selenocysteine lyase/cysteine desulfurase